MYQLKCLKEVKEIDAIRRQWDELAGTHAMRSYAWVRAWCNGFGAGKQLQVLVVSRGDSIVAILPMAIEYSLLRGRRLLLIGNGKACGDNLGTLIQSDLHRDQYGPIAKLLADWIANAQSSLKWDRIDWDGIRADNAFMKVLVDLLNQHYGLTFEFKCGEACWETSVEGGWDTYLKRLSKRARKLLREQDREFISTGRANLVVVTEANEIHGCLKQIAELHQSRWDSRQITGCFGTEGFERFVADFLTLKNETQEAFIAKLELDGKVVAGAIGYWADEELGMYLVGMDNSHADSRPGWMLNQFCLRLACTKNKKRVNFLRGDEPYKQRLGAVPICQQRWVATSQRLLPTMRYAALKRGVQVRDWLCGRSLAPVPETLSATLGDSDE